MFIGIIINIKLRRRVLKKGSTVEKRMLTSKIHPILTFSAQMNMMKSKKFA